jgi:subtilisin family serine protease
LIYANKRQRKQLSKLGITILTEYQDYVLAEADAEQVAALRKQNYEVELQQEAAPKRGVRSGRLAAMSGPAPAEFGPGRHYYLVEFVGPVKPEWLAQIQEHGGAPQVPIPPYSYIVGLDQPAYDWVTTGLPEIRSVVHYSPEMRLEPGLSDAIAADPLLSRGRILREPEARTRAAVDLSATPGAERLPSIVSVRFFEPDDLDLALPAIREMGGQPGSYAPGDTILTVGFAPDDPELGAKLERLAHLHGVRAVEAYKLRQLYNNLAARLMGAEEVRRPDGLGLTGRGEIVAVADSGLDTGDPNSIHPDFAGRVAAILSWPVAGDWATLVTNVGADDGPADARSGHGTHVAGSAVGSGAVAPQLAVRGLAPEARLIFQAIEQTLAWTDAYRREYYRQNRRFPPAYGLAGLPVRLSALFQQAYDAGARIHNNSWGGGDFGAYDEYAAEVDRFTWEHPDFLILFASGNDGVDANRDGIVDTGSITPPGTAKNCVTVGAAESVREQGGYQLPYGRLWPGLFPAEPLRSRDKPSDNADHIAAFSSRGPAQDGRIKPDVVAPGTNILSVRSRALADRNFNAWGPFAPPPGQYMFDGGTSMATPLTTGAAALVRQYLRTIRRRFNPSAALIKATLIHAACYRPSPSLPADGKAYDFAQGWGHLDLGSVLAPPAPVRVTWYDGQRGLNTGESVRFYCRKLDASAPLAVTLVYSDYPGSAGHYPTLVNDLDLVVTTPSGQIYYGNAGGPGGAPDRLNNVERVIIAQPEPGRYQIRIRGFNVPHGPQPFALVWSGGMG